MGAVRKISIALTEELALDVEKAVDSGDYATVSEVIRDALERWKDERAIRAAKIIELRRLIQEGLDSGIVDGGFDAEDVIRRGRIRLEALRAKS